MTEQSKQCQNSRNRRSKTGQSGQVSLDRSTWTGRRGDNGLKYNSKDMIARTGHPGQDSRDRMDSQDNQNMTARTGVGTGELET
jgi:hypothetical protein